MVFTFLIWMDLSMVSTELFVGSWCSLSVSVVSVHAKALPVCGLPATSQAKAQTNPASSRAMAWTAAE